MNIYQIKGEPTRFHVESSSLECGACAATFSTKEARNKALREGVQCPKCLKSFTHLTPEAAKARCPTLDVRYHLVDLGDFLPVGGCACEHFQFRLRAELEKIAPAQLRALSLGALDRLRCTHIKAARELALDVTVAHHEAVQRGGRKAVAA